MLTVGLHGSGKAKIFWITGRSIRLRYGRFYKLPNNFWLSFSHFNTKHIAIIVIVVIIIDCKQSVFFLKIGNEIGKAWRKSLKREAREPRTPVRRVR